MKLSTVAILLGAAVAAAPGVVSAEVSSCSCFDGRCSSEDASREFVLPWSCGRLCGQQRLSSLWPKRSESPACLTHTLLSARAGSG